MRSRQPETSKDNACSRCATLLRPGAARCGLCGWAAGLPYPEPEVAEIPEVAEVAEAAETPDDRPAAEQPLHADADAGDAPTVEDDEATSLDPVAVAQLEALDQLVETRPRDEKPLAAAGGAAAESETVAPVSARAAEGLVDPLTAPLSSLTQTATARTAGSAGSPEEGGLVTTLVLETGDRAAGASVPVQPLADAAIGTQRYSDVTEEHSDDRPVDTTDAGDDPDGSDPAVAPITTLGKAVASLTALVGVLALVVPLLNSFLVPDTVTSVLDAAVTLVPGLLLMALFGASVSLFLVWVSRARTHAEAVSSVRQRWARPWAVVGWLVPVAGLFIGWQVLQDLWAASDPSTRDEEDGRPPEPPIITGWLAGLVVWSVIWLIGTVMLGGSPLVEVVAGAALTASALCLGRTVRQISSWLDAN